MASGLMKKCGQKKQASLAGDLFPGHTLVDEQFKINGIIDWTEAKVADVSNDFTAFTCYSVKINWKS